MRLLTTCTLLLGLLAPLPAAAESHSSSNCSNGRCSHVESLFIEDGRRIRGYLQEQRWHEGRDWHLRRERDARPPPWHRDRRRDRDADKDD